MINTRLSLSLSLVFPRQNLLSHGKTYFLTAKLTFPRQNLLFSRQNLLFHGKTFFSKGLPKIWNPEHSESGRKAKITTESNTPKFDDK